MAKKQQVEANNTLRFTLTKEQLAAVCDTFKPAIGNKPLKFTITEGKITILLDDVGNILKYETGQEIAPSSIETFYLKSDVLKDINSNMAKDTEIQFEIDDEGGATITIGGTKLNISLPNEDYDIDDNFIPNDDDNSSEQLLMDKAKALCERLKVVYSTGSNASRAMRVGKTIEMGSRSSYTIIKDGNALQNIEFVAISQFFSFFQNITKFGDVLNITLGKLGEDGHRYVELHTGNVTYLVRLIGDDVQVPDLQPTIDSVTTGTTVNKTLLANELNKLNIPLIGMKEEGKLTTIEIENDVLICQVRDISKRVSVSRIPLAKSSGTERVLVNINTLGSSIAPLDEDFDINWFSEAIVLEDDVQITIVSAANEID